MASEYRLERAELGQAWDQYVASSCNGTIFFLTDYLICISDKAELYYCLYGDETRAAVALTVNAAGDAVLNNFIIHNGIIFSPPSHNQNRSQQHSEHFEIMSFIASELATRYRNVELRLCPSIQDIRPFLWFNYGCQGVKYVQNVRYTSYLDISDFAVAQCLDDISSYKNSSSSRRQEIRYAIRDNVCSREEFMPDKFLSLYQLTMARQGIVVGERTFMDMSNLLHGLFEKKLGRMFVSYTSSGELGSMAFFGVDKKRAYYLFGANNPSLRDSHTGTAVLWDAFRALSINGVTEVDLEGVNSPKRGWFKLSFGGDIRPYFHLALSNSSEYRVRHA